MADLEEKLKEADRGGARFKLISTDGVFSMNGYISRLDEICDLADKYDALVHFDDAHATGFIGKEGRGTHEYRDCVDRVDITTGHPGKGPGWRQRWLHQRQKGNCGIAAATLQALSLLQ